MIARIVAVLTFSLALAAQTTAPAGGPTPYRIAGTIVDSVSRQPMAGVTVSINSSEDLDFSGRMTTGADGRFSFSSIPAGKYTLIGSAYGYRAQGYHQHGDYFVGIAVGPGLDSDSILFRLVRDARIDGTVTDDDNEPVRTANIALYRRNNDNGKQQTRQSYSAVTDDRGHYLIAHLPPGTYYVAVSARPWFSQYFYPNELSPESDNAERVAEERAQMDIAYPLTFYPSVEDSASATAIVLRPGDHVTADIVMRAMPAVHLRIKAAASRDTNAGGSFGRAFPQVSQRIFDGAVAPVSSSQSSCNGTQGCDYTGIAPGHYLIEMQNPGEKGQRGWYKEMDLNGTVELDAAESPPLASVAGAVAFEGGNRPPGRVDILLSERSTGETAVAEVGAKGAFNFSDNEVRPGSYDVALSIGQGVQISHLEAKGARVAGKTVEISGGGVQLAVTATRALSRINGTVLRGDKPFAGAMVVLIPPNPEKNFTLFRRDESDSDGTFSLRDVLPGSYTVIAIDNAWDLDWAAPTTLQAYAKNGLPVEISGETKLTIKVPLQ